MSSLCDGLAISFDINKSDKIILEQIKQFFLSCIEKHPRTEIDKLYNQITDDKNYESFNFPYVILIRTIFKNIILHKKINEDGIKLLLELSDYMDNSYKIAVLDHFALYKTLHSSNSELDEFYQKNSNFIQLHQNSDECIGPLPVAIYSIHACIFYLNINNQVKAMQYCKIASNIFQAKICVQGLLSIQALMSIIYAQMNQNETAISIQLEILDKIDDDFKKAYCLENIGKLYFKKKDYAKAANYFHESIKKDKNTRQSHFYILYLLLNKNIHNKEPFIEDISNCTDMIAFYRAASSNNFSAFDLFDRISSSITDFNLKKIYFDFIYKFAKQVNSDKKALYYADSYITLLTSSQCNTSIKDLNEILVFI